MSIATLKLWYFVQNICRNKFSFNFDSDRNDLFATSEMAFHDSDLISIFEQYKNVVDFFQTNRQLA